MSHDIEHGKPQSSNRSRRISVSTASALAWAFAGSRSARGPGSTSNTSVPGSSSVVDAATQ
jgi:hypothetical protein